MPHFLQPVAFTHVVQRLSRCDEDSVPNFHHCNHTLSRNQKQLKEDSLFQLTVAIRCQCLRKQDSRNSSAPGSSLMQRLFTLWQTERRNSGQNAGQ